MDNPNASEAVRSAAYVEDYIDAVENLPDDVQRQLSRIREIDVQIQNNLRDVDHDYDLHKALVNSDDPTDNRRAQAIARMQQSLVAVQTLTDEKIEIKHKIKELIEKTTDRLDADLKNLGIVEDQQQDDIPSVYSDNPGDSANGVCTSAGHGSSSDGDYQRSGNRRSKRLNDGENAMEFCANTLGSNGGTCDSGTSTSRHATPKSSGYTLQGRGGTSTGSVGSVSTAGSGIGSSTTGASGKKKKRKARAKQATNTSKESPPPDPIDSDEPTYCLCERISFGEMILCDNDLCPIGWFHFSCVSVVSKPRGKWYCPRCRADRPNVMKPRAQLLKELERYNKEQEEKF